MCGVVGLWHRDGRPVDPESLRAMVATLGHRGPDDRAVWVHGNVGLGHARLSIIDLGSSAQPMHNAAGQHLVFNGEIFNYRQVRQSLRYDFRTSGDTETLLAALQQHGTQAMQHLNGQFAFASFDEERRVLLLARDRLGILPLYYVWIGETLAFASEVKALMPLFHSAPTLDEVSLSEYFTTRAVRAPYTLLRGVRKLRPGHYLQVSAVGTPVERRYWSLPTQQDSWSDRDAIAAVDGALHAAVDASLVADVPVGAYLSGGLDSSLLTALAVARRPAADPLHTFSAGFKDAVGNADELPWARHVSQHLGTTHHEVRLGADDFQDGWERLTWMRDAPLSEPADAAVAALAKVAREHVKVVLSGEGADELFAGYPKYRVDPVVSLSSHLPARWRQPPLKLLQHWLPASKGRLQAPLRAAGAANEMERFGAWFSPFALHEIDAAMPSTAGERVVRQRAIYEDVTRGHATRLARMLAYDLGTWLPDNLLERGDRMSMASSLETRPTFLDHRFVELAFNLPDRMKLRGRSGKWALKQVAAKHLPQAVIGRPKAGFPVPLATWFKADASGMLHGLVASTDSLCVEVFGQRAVNELLQRHASGKANESGRLWTMLSLEMWNRGYRAGGTLAA